MLWDDGFRLLYASGGQRRARPYPVLKHRWIAAELVRSKRFVFCLCSPFGTWHAYIGCFLSLVSVSPPMVGRSSYVRAMCVALIASFEFEPFSIFTVSFFRDPFLATLHAAYL